MISGAAVTDLDVDQVLATLSRADDPDLSEVVTLVAEICDSEAAGITIRRGDEYHVPVTHGIEPMVCAVDDTFCRYTMSTDGVFCVEDATTDPRFAEIGWVTGTLATARFYASAPIYSPSGTMVGRLCVLDPAAKRLTPLQQRALEAMALSTTKLIELRLLQAARLRSSSPEARQSTTTLLSQLAAELSHDMRVPLSAIVASVEMLREELADHPERAVGALLSSAVRAAERLERMLEQLMGIGGSLGRQEVDLQRLADQLTLDSASLLQARGAAVEAVDLPVVWANPDDMYSVLQNLVTNSLKFGRPGVPVVVSISARRAHGGWRISVRDNGIGIPETRRADVFSLFSRVDHDVAGHGIGLATVARIVHEHGGQVRADPAPGGGTEIWVELPDHDAEQSGDQAGP